MLKGIVLDQLTLGAVTFKQELLELCDWEFYDSTEPEEVVNRIKDKDVILTNKVKLNENNLKYTEVKYIGVLATGTNNIDLDYCKSNKIEVKNAVGYSTDSVTQHTFTLLFELLGRTSYFDPYVKSGEYSGSPVFTNFGREYFEVKNKRWGIIGLGNIGKQVANVAAAFGSEIVYYSSSNEDRSTVYQRLSLEELLATSDIISIHAPLNEKTQNLINTDQFKLMKPQAVLINVGRGGIVKESALIEALNDNLLAGACLDVFEQEPFDYKEKYAPLKDHSKLVLSPHIAWASIEARQKLLDITNENLIKWIKK